MEFHFINGKIGYGIKVKIWYYNNGIFYTDEHMHQEIWERAVKEKVIDTLPPFGMKYQTQRHISRFNDDGPAAVLHLR